MIQIVIQILSFVLIGFGMLCQIAFVWEIVKGDGGIEGLKAVPVLGMISMVVGYGLYILK